MWTDRDIQTGWKFPNVIDDWVDAWEKRNQLYPITEKQINEFSDVANDINEKGYCVLKNVFNKNDIKSLYEKTKHTE